MQMARGAAAWSDIQKAILLESLGRSEEADVYYALRKGSKAKGTSHQIQLAQLALITGDEAAWLEQLETHAKEEWVGVMFLRNELQRLLDSEGLSTLTLEEVDRWFDESTQSGKPLTKTIRFQSLFKRLGRKDLEAKVQQRIESYVAASDSEQRLRLWDGILGEWSRYGLEERRLDCLALLCQAMEGDKSGGDIRSSRRGPAKVGEPKTVTLDSLFFKAFPNFRSAAYPVYESLVARLPDANPATRLSVVEDLHAGRLPSGWTGGELEMFFRDTIRRWLSDPGQLEPMLVDMADALDVMGMTDSALELLRDFSDSHAANLQIAMYVAKLGRIDEAAQLSLNLVNRHPDDVNAYLLATQRLAEAKQFDDWLALQRRTLSQLNAWELVERYFQTARRSQRLEPQPEILFLLELLCEHQPSTWYEIWFGDAYTQYGSRILTDWYHRSVATHPERIGKLANLARRQCLDEIRSLGDNDVPNPGGVGVAARWEVDWPLWCMQYERCIAAGFWQSVQQGDKETAERLLHTARRMYPEQINTLIDASDLIRGQFGEDVLRQWFDIYYQPMKRHLESFPTDTLTANNAAWLAAKCGFEIEQAWALASGVVAQSPTDTYLDTLAEVEFVRGNVARALEISERCRSMQPRDSHHGRQIARFKLALKATEQSSDAHHPGS
jgi:tetratricopeptide (TPR) repeat protein